MKRNLAAIRYTGSVLAFSMIELIVVIAILAVLAALVMPVAGRLTDKSKLTKCVSNLKQWGVGFQLYMTDHDGRLPQSEEIQDNTNSQWQEKIAPYLVGDSGVVGSQRFVMRERFRCPADKLKGGIVYGGNIYLRPTQYGKAPSKLVGIAPNKSDFMLLAENYTGELWDARPRSATSGVDYNRHKIGSKAVANFLFADFHVESMTYEETLARPMSFVPTPATN